MKRPSLPQGVEIEVLRRSGRRCALCFGVDNDFSEKQGQIAHLDKNPSNHAVGNLAYLCLNHHDRFDGKTSQSKGYRSAEIRVYREELYERVSSRKDGNDLFDKEVARFEERYEAVKRVEARFSSFGPSKEVLQKQILTRCSAVFEFLRTAHGSPDSADHILLMETLEIPPGVEGLVAEGDLPTTWLEETEELVSIWMAGIASYEQCTDIVFEFEDRYDLDLHWILFGISSSNLPRLAYEMLKYFVYVFGMRNQSGPEN